MQSYRLRTDQRLLWPNLIKQTVCLCDCVHGANMMKQTVSMEQIWPWKKLKAVCFTICVVCFIPCQKRREMLQSSDPEEDAVVTRPIELAPRRGRTNPTETHPWQRAIALQRQKPMRISRGGSNNRTRSLPASGMHVTFLHARPAAFVDYSSLSLSPRMSACIVCVWPRLLSLLSPFSLLRSFMAPEVPEDRDRLNERELKARGRRRGGS